MAYIPLSPNEKVKGKAAVDVVGSRLGKTGANFIQLIFIEMFTAGSVLSVSHLLLPIVILTTAAWMYSINHIGKEFYTKTKKEDNTLKVKK